MAGDTKEESFTTVFYRRSEPGDPRSLMLTYQLDLDTAVGRLLVTQAMDGPLERFEVAVDYRLDNDEVVLHDMTFRPLGRLVWHAAPAGRALRAVRLGHVPSAVGDILNDTKFGGVWAALLPDWIAAFHRGRRTGRGGTSLVVYAVWAKRRVEAQEAEPKSPVRWLSKKYGYSVSAINAFISATRDKGLLEGTRGHVWLTPLAERILTTPEAQKHLAEMEH